MSSFWGPSLPVTQPLAEPEHTDPGEQVTPADIVSMVAQRLHLAGTPAVVTRESLDAAAHGAELLLTALGIAIPTEEHGDHPRPEPLYQVRFNPHPMP